MLYKENILALFSLLAITSALDATLEKSVFYVASINYLSYDMFQTSQGIIAHSTPNYTGIPMQDEYQLINLKTHSVTQVLSDIVTACGRDAFQFDKLHYHAVTATLVYYCLVNNSLLILDEQDWTVQSTIATNIVANFSEVKIVTDGYSIAILGMGPLNSTSALPSQFIKVDLQSRQIVNNMTFDHDLKPGERVTGYASNGNSRYIVTNTIGDSTNNVTVYSLKIIANSYSITLLASISEEYNTVVTLLYCVGDLIVTNSKYTVVVISDGGTILGTIKNVTFSSLRLANKIAFTSEPGSNEFYTQLRNGTFLKSTFKNKGYITENIGDYIGDFKLVFGSPTGDSMLMTSGYWGNFTITDTKTSKIVYTMINGDVGFLTDSTYILEESDTLYFFSRETDAFLQTIDINDLSYLFEPENNLISYLSSADDGKCQLVQIDINTGVVTVALTFKNPYSDYPCPGELINVTNNEHGAQAVLENLDSYFIISQTFGMINFTIPNEDYDPSSVAVDYETLEVYYFVSGAEKSEIRSYEYDSNTKNLSLKTTTNMSLNNGRIFYTEANQVLVFAKGGYMDLIKLPSLEQRTYMMDSPYNQISGFKDKSGKTYTILTTLIEDTPEIFYDDEFHLLPGGTDATIDGGAAGQCAYWVLDQVDNFELIRFYDICASKKNEKIDA